MVVITICRSEKFFSGSYDAARSGRRRNSPCKLALWTTRPLVKLRNFDHGSLQYLSSQRINLHAPELSHTTDTIPRNSLPYSVHHHPTLPKRPQHTHDSVHSWRIYVGTRYFALFGQVYGEVRTTMMVFRNDDKRKAAPCCRPLPYLGCESLSFLMASLRSGRLCY